MIGGEFEIDLSLQADSFVPQPDTYYYASGRTALYQVLCSLSLRHNIIWLPDWLCHTMIHAVKKAGFECQYYNLDASLKASVEALDISGFKDGEIVLMVNYFGLQNLTTVSKSIKEEYPRAIIIEDDVQAYWEFSDMYNPYADYRFTSLRKAFAIPDGGLVKTKNSLPTVLGRNSFAPLKIKAGVMKFNRGKDGILDSDYLALFKQADLLIPENYDSVMSIESQRLYAGADLLKVKTKRQENTAYILKGLSEIGLKPLLEVSSDCVPLFIPVWIENRDEVRRKMFMHDVFCPFHWPLPSGLELKKGKEMAEHELSLIIDQRYSQKEMNEILSQLA